MIRNERGSMAILFALGIVSVGALVAIQMSSSFRTVHSQHAVEKARLNASQSMQRLAMQFKQSAMLGKLYGHVNCNLGSGRQLTLKTIGRLNLCLPSGNTFCVEMPSEDGQPTSRACASLADRALAWRSTSDQAVTRAIATVRQETESTQASGVQQPERRRTQNRITIPATSSTLWKTCGGVDDNCIRLALCADGVSNCTERNAVAFQVIRIN